MQRAIAAYFRLPEVSWPTKISLVLLALFPVGLVYARAVADISLTLICVLFLVESGRTRNWTWLRRPWVALAFVLWLLIVAGSAHTGPQASLLQGLASLRLFLFTAALEAWLLRQETAQRWTTLVLRILAFWLIIQVWQQYFTGQNIWGDGRWADGALTGPFYKPRAGAVFLMVFFVGLMPWVLELLRRNTTRGALQGTLLLIFLMVTMILIGQRMPNMLALFGMALAALLDQRLRKPALAAFALGVVLLISLPVISPPTYTKLIVQLSEQLSHFAASPYGELFTRAGVMMEMHPWLGVGFDGFRNLCADPAYQHGLTAYGIPTVEVFGPEACNLHPHNYYMQIGSIAGFPGLILFIGLVVLWIARASRLAASQAGAQAGMLVVIVCVMLWPAQSTSSFFVIDTGGWIFLHVGWALALVQRPIDSDRADRALAGLRSGKPG